MKAALEAFSGTLGLKEHNFQFLGARIEKGGTKEKATVGAGHDLGPTFSP